MGLVTFVCDGKVIASVSQKLLPGFEDPSVAREYLHKHHLYAARYAHWHKASQAPQYTLMQGEYSSVHRSVVGGDYTYHLNKAKGNGTSLV